MTNYIKLINTLKEVFMLDKAELDFGIYRIMNQKRKDIEQFLEEDIVTESFLDKITRQYLEVAELPHFELITISLDNFKKDE
jgi:hypothetical protein